MNIYLAIAQKIRKACVCVCSLPHFLDMQSFKAGDLVRHFILLWSSDRYYKKNALKQTQNGNEFYIHAK